MDRVCHRKMGVSHGRAICNCRGQSADRNGRRGIFAAWRQNPVKTPSNAAMVAKSSRMVGDLGAELLTAAQTRDMLNLPKSNEG